MRGLADGAGMGFADFRGHSLGLVDVAAKKVLGLMPTNEVANRGGTSVHARTDLIECRAVRRRMANQHQRRETGKAFEARGELCFAVFSRRMERCGIGIAEARDVPLA